MHSRGAGTARTQTVMRTEGIAECSQLTAVTTIATPGRSCALAASSRTHAVHTSDMYPSLLLKNTRLFMVYGIANSCNIVPRPHLVVACAKVEFAFRLSLLPRSGALVRHKIFCRRSYTSLCTGNKRMEYETI